MTARMDKAIDQLRYALGGEYRTSFWDHEAIEEAARRLTPIQLRPWMHAAAEEYLRQAHPDLMDDMINELAGIIAKHAHSDTVNPNTQGTK
jgi:hypothetical protein